MIVTVILVLIVLVNAFFAIAFIRDLLKNREALGKEPGNPIAMAIVSFFLFFLSTFGISDFAIGAAIYPKLRWTTTKKLPGTLNTECVIPVAVMALAYISSIAVGLPTLIVPIVAQVIGAYVSPRFVVRLPAKAIKVFVSIGLLVASVIILIGLPQINLFPVGGEATELVGAKLVILGVLSLIYGALNNIGIGSYALTMATVYALGLSPLVAFPIMMGACTFSVPVGSMQFIKFGQYSRKITLFTSIFGSIGVLVAAFLVKSLNTDILKIVVLAVILYSAITMLLSIRKKDEDEDAASAPEGGPVGTNNPSGE